MLLAKALLVFGAMFALDWVWAKYAQAITAKKSVVASNMAVAICVLSATSVITYAAEPVLVFPAALGAWAGTYVSVRPS